ncbi:glutamine-hydrolyzing GMP synthase [Ruminococcaceae bacterium OttesenSCG-928-O06]|nr:glutamine-hydrolyzing GMP synthase [Ruminococcaceae bacterium OttesenSCG-928-O06]
MSHQTIIIVDFGGQYNQLIARRVRENNVYCEVVPYKDAIKAIREKKPVGIIFTGGPASVYQPSAPDIDAAVYDMGIPILGICYGAQLMAQALGGKVERQQRQEFGKIPIQATGGLIQQVVDSDVSWMSHNDQIVQPPAGFATTATSELCPYAAIEDAARKLYAVQFHPEVEHTPFGRAFLRVFLYEVCGCTGDWTTASFVQATIEDIQKTVGEGRVLCALSGGVDSTVCAVLTHKAIGERLTCVFVDHGLMRKNEGDEVMDTLAKEFKLNVIRVNAGERFLAKLAGVTDPEQKRKIIGAEFIEVFTEEAQKLGKMDFLLQGTIYPDIIESGVGDAALIKSHHNVGGLPEKLGFTLLEPLRLLFKDEVRRVGTQLGIPRFIVQRQPFPGPGLAVRCLGEVREDKLFILRESDAILRQEIAAAHLDEEIWQYFTVLPNLRSVGVMGDERTYAHAVGIRAVTSTDAMTSDWARIPYEVLERISTRIVNEVSGVNRILYDCTTKPPSTIEWE